MERIKPVQNISKCIKIICPSPEELSVITNNIKCDKCGLVFKNEPRYRLHDLKVHQRKKLDKTIKQENIRYHCPVESCIYAAKAERHFSSMKYLKQHYLKVHAKKTHACTRCDKSFSTEAAKEGHMRVCGIEFVCSCSKTYTSYEALLTHAKRTLHTINDKYKNSLRRTNSKTMRLILSTNQTEMNKLVTILPINQNENKISHHNNDSTRKLTSDIGIQTDEHKKNKRMSSPLKHINNGYHHNGKRGISKQTQTSISQRVNKQNVMSMETQTIQAAQAFKNSLKLQKHGKNSVSQSSDYTLLKEDLNLGNFATSNLFPGSPLPLRHDDGLQDFWEDKSTSGTQTIPEKDMFEVLNDNVTQTEFETLYDHSTNPLIQCTPKSTVALMTLPYVEETSTVVEGYSFVSSNSISRSDPMLTDKTFDDKFSSIETQTEQAYSQSFFDSDPLTRSFALSSTIETQTTNNLDNMELLYSTTCTQTCNEILSTDLGLSNIQTQTPWSQLDDTTVSAETQTKSLICETGCNISIGACRSWLSTQTSHTETQTDLLSIFEGLQ